MSLRTLLKQELRSPPSLESDMLFAYPMESAGASASMSAIDLKRIPSEGSLLVKKVVDGGLEEEDSPGVVDFLCSFGSSEILKLSKDQSGCRMLQKQLAEGSQLFVDYIFAVLSPHFAELMIDPFGNYLSQMLVGICSYTQLKQTIELVLPSVVDMALNNYGTRSVQKLIETACKHKCEGPIVAALNKQIIRLAKDPSGNHVIQKCLLVLERKDFILKQLADNVRDLGMHRYGCCILQKAIEASGQKNVIIGKVIENAVDLVQNAHGNYLVQFILDLKRQKNNARLAELFTPKICLLSKQKFSSNAIEKCLELAPVDAQKAMIFEIVKNVPCMICDQYANYVVQKALDLAPPSQSKALAQAIAGQYSSLQATPLGKKICAKLLRICPTIEKCNLNL